ncbi:hypothetical protein FH972_012716 [Carpinus fangiana]|uniref:Uncharacterized protein n=1 Tax=Carpinus fangiana TaxID=176857 RepID=A0A5N6R708_9ROSI|nr:hypothetical protein FH972_012716 [Carpinus fangiana]
MARRKEKREVGRFLTFLLLVFAVFETTASEERAAHSRNAYATMLYMGTPRDYEFYVATRVMIRSLVRLDVEADLVVIASLEALTCAVDPSLVWGFDIFPSLDESSVLETWNVGGAK